MSRSIIPLFIVSSIFLSSCGEKSHETVSRDSHRTVHGDYFEGKGYILKNVYGWGESKGFMGTDRMLQSAKENRSDDFQENVNVTLQDVPRGTTAQALLSRTAEDMKKMFTLEDDLSYSPTKVGDCEGYVTHFRHKMGVFDLAQDHYVVLDGNHAYSITCTAEESAYEEFKPKFDAIVKTFALK